MVNPVYQSFNHLTNAPGPQAPVNLDNYKANFNVRAAVYIASGAANYSVEFTLDDLNMNPNPRWFADPKLGLGQVTNGFTEYVTPITFVRLNIDSYTGVIEFKVVQGID